MDSPDHFVGQLTDCQSGLYAYIFSLLGDPDQARDTLQETNLILWAKRGDFDVATSFSAWAFTIARFQVMAARKKLSRERLKFSDALIQQLTDHAAGSLDPLEDRRRAMEGCIKELTEAQRELLHRRYDAGETVESIARHLNRPATTLARVLHRIRLALLKCIETRVAGSTP